MFMGLCVCVEVVFAALEPTLCSSKKCEEEAEKVKIAIAAAQGGEKAKKVVWKS